MTKRLKFNLKTWLFYTIMFYIIILPYQNYITGISVSLILGFFAGIFNDIIIQLRKLNGEKFDNIE